MTSPLEKLLQEIAWGLLVLLGWLDTEVSARYAPPDNGSKETLRMPADPHTICCLESVGRTSRSQNCRVHFIPTPINTSATRTREPTGSN
ncbi:uncharacterized protein J3R85_009688 [Psidium guajava]|nr:uncharacterized protein J3R85_009688 [Psidium guajava]